MKTFRRFGLFLFAAFALAMALPALACRTVVSTFHAAKSLVLGGIEHVLSQFNAEKRINLNPITLLVQSCAYATRLAKRERPRMESTWRMCPSA